MDPIKNQMEADQQKQRVLAVFNAASADYDNAALRFFPFTAGRMVDYLQPHRGWKILDVATGTGALSLSLAQAVGGEGRVIGVDLSEGMLAQAEKNMKKVSIENVDFFQMDAENLEFDGDYFHAVTCSFGLFFFPDMAKALAQWVRVTRPNGVLLFSSFTEKAFSQLGECFFEDLATTSVDMSNVSMASEQLNDAAACEKLMSDAGCINIQQTTMQMGYHLEDENGWWDVLRGAALRGLLELIPESEKTGFKEKHLARIAALCTDDGLWLDVEVRLTMGVVPE